MRNINNKLPHCNVNLKIRKYIQMCTNLSKKIENAKVSKRWKMWKFSPISLIALPSHLHISLYELPRGHPWIIISYKNKNILSQMILCKCFEILRKKYWEANLGFRAAYECLAAVKLGMTNRLSFNIHFTLSSSLSNIFRWENRFQ